MNWYVLKILSGKERKIKESILMEAKLAGLSEQIPEVLAPSEKVTEMKDGKKG